jgi:hypothetical protein|tara:strand:+ start:2159 stop:2395 length:237 start_codon:yes stop_codon:yes gene_type:complete
MTDPLAASVRFQETFFKAVNAVAKVRDLADKDVAALSDLRPSYYSMLKNGKRTLPINAMLKIDLALNLNLTLTFRSHT